MQILNIDLDQHLTTNYGEEYWLEVTVSYKGKIQTIKKLILLDYKPQNLMFVKVHVFYEKNEIEDHLNKIENDKYLPDISDDKIRNFYRELTCRE